MKRICALAAAALLTGCAGANLYDRSYQPASDTARAPATVDPIVERSKPALPDVVLPVYAKRGYEMIGSAAFRTRRVAPESDAIAQGRAVGADLVLIFNPQYSETVSALPLALPMVTTANTTGSATAYGPAGTATAYGQSTTTYTGSQLFSVPVTTRFANNGAVFFVKTRQALGVYIRALNDEERQALETNRGVAVTLVVDDTPAFSADILPGDVIRAIDGQETSTPQRFAEVVDSARGKRVAVDLLRKGQPVQKTVQLRG